MELKDYLVTLVDLRLMVSVADEIRIFFHIYDKETAVIRVTKSAVRLMLSTLEIPSENLIEVYTLGGKKSLFIGI